MAWLGLLPHRVLFIACASIFSLPQQCWPALLPLLVPPPHHPHPITTCAARCGTASTTGCSASLFTLSLSPLSLRQVRDRKHHGLLGHGHGVLNMWAAMGATNEVEEKQVHSSVQVPYYLACTTPYLSLSSPYLCPYLAPWMAPIYPPI